MVSLMCLLRTYTRGGHPPLSPGAGFYPFLFLGQSSNLYISPCMAAIVDISTRSKLADDGLTPSYQARVSVNEAETSEVLGTWGYDISMDGHEQILRVGNCGSTHFADLNEGMRTSWA